jgi:16S rRNA (cytosine1402-N4)-methyltransferase
LDVHHEPVLVAESLELLAPGRGGWFVDCTLGLGGHAEILLEASPTVRLLGIDRDLAALERARRRLARFAGRVHLVAANFHQIGRLLAGIPGKLAGVFADLGVSSMQLDVAQRGFSFRFEGPLDMRMGPGGLTAADILNRYPEAELEKIFRDYGEERQARRIARAVVRARSERPLSTTGDLKAVIDQVKGQGRPAGYGRRREGRVDPATRVFQALRIEVNQELAGLEEAISSAIRLLERDGRLVVISYHSLEDRIVKHTLRELAQGEVDPVTGRPLAESRLIEVLTRKPIRPSAQEEAANPRSRSARLRAARRL